MHRFKLAIVFQGKEKAKTYSFATWEHRSCMLKQLPDGCQVCAYEEDWKPVTRGAEQ